MRTKKNFPKIFENELFLSTTLIILTALITYGNNIIRPGYYHDDWYVLWSAQARGISSLIPLFATDRPFMGVLYSIIYRLLGDALVNWQIYALTLRLAGALAFYWILRLVWPQNKYTNTLITILFLVYPGFLSIPNANTKQNHLYGFGSALLSIAIMLQALKSSKPWLKYSGLFLSFLLTINYLFVYEYMIGLEAMRLALLGYTQFRQDGKLSLTFITGIIKKWWPFPIAMAGFLYWRMFIFESTRNATDAARLAGDYFGNLRPMLMRLVFETAKDFLDTVVFAWFYKPYTFFANAEYAQVGLAFLLALLVIIIIILYGKATRSPLSDAAAPQSKNSLIPTLLILGTLITLCAIFPVVLSGRNVDLADTYKSYGLHPAAGIAMLIMGLILTLQPKFQKSFLLALIFLAVMTHQFNTDDWQQLWKYQRESWYQLTWRAPDIKDDTLVMVYFPDGYRLQQDYEIWGPINLIYRPAPAKSPAIQAEVLTADTAYDLSKQVIRDNFDRDIKLHRDFNKLLLITLPSSISCIHIIDGNMPVYSEFDAQIVRQIGSYSKPGQITTTGTAPTPPQGIFQSEPAHTWCYYYQKASLARQQGDWKEIGRLYDQATSSGLKALDKSEVIPFFEGLVNLNRIEDARALFNKEIKGQGKMRTPLCEKLLNNPAYSPAPGYNTPAIYQILCQS